MSNPNSSAESIRIGGACGFWGESAMATPQLLAGGEVDYLVYDYLAEITMSILARARARDADAGYATDFVSEVMASHLDAIAAAGVKVLSNAGGVNPEACARAIEALIAERCLDLTVAVVTGDDIVDRAAELAARDIREQFSAAAFPNPASIASINAYLGAEPIRVALADGADIVITGRCADSALTLAACRHAFGWADQDWDRLAAGSLAGHLLECGPQATGGNFTDWRPLANGLADIGYPVAEVFPDGGFVIGKPPATGGVVTPDSVGEQLLYEIEDPQCYVLPDVVCDFSEVTLEQAGADRVRVAGARGRPATDSYKVSATYLDGFRGGMLLSFVGFEAAAKARAYAEAALTRTERVLKAAGAPGLAETSVELIGAGEAVGRPSADQGPGEVVLKLAARHARAEGIVAFIRAVTGLALATPAGLAIFNAGRPRPQPVVRLFSFLLPKAETTVVVETGGESLPIPTVAGRAGEPAPARRPDPPPPPGSEAVEEVPLIRLALARSGDKGNRVNIGVIPRHPAFLPWIWQALSSEAVAARFADYLEGPVDRYLLPGMQAMNFVLHDVLGGGGVASLRNDPQGKTYAQLLLDAPIPVSAEIAAMLKG
jgi:hypothetical protein